MTKPQGDTMDEMMAAALQTYFNESRELLEGMESDLLELDSGNLDGLNERLNAIFRAAHTVKGSAGIFNLNEIVRFTHKVESLLDLLRSEQLKLHEKHISLLLECRDHMVSLIDDAQTGQESSEDDVTGQRLGARLSEFLGQSEPESHSPATESEPDHTALDNFCWHISLTFPLHAFQDGMDPLSFLSYLTTLGEVIYIEAVDRKLPDWHNFDPECCYLGFELRFYSPASKQQIEDVFEFIREEGDVRIFPPSAKVGDFIEHIQSMPDENYRIGEILVRCGALTETELKRALQQQSERREASSDAIPIGEIITQADAQLAPVLNAAVDKQSKAREALTKEQKSLRVDAEKLDTLINLVGELVTAGASSALQAELIGENVMIESVARLNGLLEEVRDAALQLRMVAIGATFARFQRVVRDMAKELNKSIHLTITGADTELDKSVIEKIGDPLMHLVRNAIDHGIETEEERVANGKPSHGTITLNAYHDSGNIVIDVSDDGKGLNSEKLRAKAIEKGLLDENQLVSDDEIFQLIFEPGFSTAQQVSNISGRGVGMDVVKRNITDLRGRVEIHSLLNRGTTIRIVLPLTLAIIDGFLIEVSSETFVVPLDAVQECVELDDQWLKDGQGKPYINLRGQVLPLIDLRVQFNLTARRSKRQNVVVVSSAGQSAGLIVDNLLGELQTVIKPLGPIFSRVKGISGSTILGSGDIALILDIASLSQHIMKEESKHRLLAMH
ncbi:chemotaxis protein CheA [Vibrio anguillarum]|uniref:chemotaxis protein CheA n=1 Tax=Vibrio anguillarum TaxID=55601 RepID=UPI000E1B5464|nr:chemotaxis protein CheA [Vibrio anguillarum]MBF4281318.1 chemotaxis protein CheA [Vibrio anguillarum]MBF4288666.1 chemotaxis protein CheA [Vibrio anguillarum]MBF4340174.1 chemotaxis protein CheA [Vibrio anguillarum]MBF4357891.1 chemotaxis protein CheA [Vibrio anguillarum]MBF4377760.1 chemotaxis protein CheA [Vibrio anguillarum]